MRSLSLSFIIVLLLGASGCKKCFTCNTGNICYTCTLQGFTTPEVCTKTSGQEVVDGLRTACQSGGGLWTQTSAGDGSYEFCEISTNKNGIKNLENMCKLNGGSWSAK